MGRVPEPGESWFRPEDTEAVLQWQREKDHACPGCGQPRDEAWDQTRHSHYVGAVAVCYACQARDVKEKQDAMAFERAKAGPHAMAGRYYFPRERD